MKVHCFLLSTFFWITPCIQMLGQTAGADPALVEKKFKNKYFLPSVSLNIINYTDFATSPLAYVGTGMNGGVGWLWETGKREHFLDFDFLTSAAIALAPESDYYSTSTSSLVLGIGIYDHYLFQVFKPHLPDFLDLKIGVALNSSTFLRSNSSLNNNGTGIESILNLMVAAKATVDISRKKEWTLDMFLFKKTLYPVKRNISFQFNAGLLNLNFRPGYAYNSDAEFNGSETNILLYLLDSHRWSVNGSRLTTRLEYTRYRPSGNGHRYAYIWDAAFIPGYFDNFQIATHRLQYTIIINLN